MPGKKNRLTRILDRWEIYFLFFKIFIVIQLQLYAFSPHPSTTIKDTWTKSRGKVEAGEGGGFGWGGVEWRDGEKIQTTVIE